MTTSSSDAAATGRPPVPRRSLVTGGAGFIGSNLAHRLAAGGGIVTVLDDLSRPGAARNVRWLEGEVGDRVSVVRADVRDAAAVRGATAGVDVVYHLAGQTAVTTSITDPRADFEVNALGTLNVLEAARSAAPVPTVVYASTNKVYGRLEGVDVVEEATRFSFAALPEGIDERQPLDLASPYACSKGAGDQYTLDYHRVFGVPTVVFRQSCVYGPRQLGSEEQGWVAWFLAAAALGSPITIFGSGKQVRDILHVDDLVDALLLATAAIEETAGRAYNIGGGAARTLSIWSEFEPRLARIFGQPVAAVQFAPARPVDQPVFYCDTRAAAADFGWSPRIGVDEGLRCLSAWVLDNLDLYRPTVAAP